MKTDKEIREDVRTLVDKISGEDPPTNSELRDAVCDLAQLVVCLLPQRKLKK